MTRAGHDTLSALSVAGVAKEAVATVVARTSSSGESSARGFDASSSSALAVGAVARDGVGEREGKAKHKEEKQEVLHHVGGGVAFFTGQKQERMKNKRAQKLFAASLGHSLQRGHESTQRKGQEFKIAGQWPRNLIPKIKRQGVGS